MSPWKNAEMPTDQSCGSTCGAAQEHRSSDYGSEGPSQRRASFKPVADACGGVPQPRCGLVRAAGITQFGNAAWYGLVGNQTASGCRLDELMCDDETLEDFMRKTAMANR